MHDLPAIAEPSIAPVVPILALLSSSQELVEIVTINDAHALVDMNGNERLLRGMAVAYKEKPYIPLTDHFDPVRSFAKEDIAIFKRLRLNLIRLAVPWAAVEPTEGLYDDDYLEKIANLVRECAQAGIYVIVEAHQDLYADRFGGNGMPAWTITKDRTTLAFPRPIALTKARYDGDGPPTNFELGDDWGKFYASDACTRAWYGLYTDERILSAFVRYWEHLARKFVGMTNVVGYELVNEPFVAARTTLTVPYALINRASTDRNYLQPLYDRVTKAIRTIDDRSLIFYEPATGGGSNSGEGFKTVPGGDGEKAKSVMSFHSYGPNLIDGHTMAHAIQIRLKQVQKLGGSLMLTEFDCEYDRGRERIREVMELCDASRIPWAGWQYKQYVLLTGSAPSGTLWDPKTGALRPEMTKLFSRPFPSSVAGALSSFRFDWDLSTLHLSYIPRIKGTSLISLNSEVEMGWGEWNVTVLEASKEFVQVVHIEGGIELTVLEGWEGNIVDIEVSLVK